MKLYLIRHGITDDHEKNIRQTADSPLGEYGVKQAKKVAERIRGLKFDHLYSSELRRAKQTAEVISEQLKLPLKTNNLFRESEKSKTLNKVAYEGEVNQRFLKEREENRENFDWKFDGDGESVNDVIARGKKVLDYLTANHSEETVLVVSHAYLIGVLTSLMLLGYDFDQKSFARLFQGLRLENTGLCSYEYDPETSKWKVICYNDHSHLTSL